MASKGLSNPMVVIGLTNGMIGGIILVMPLLSIKTGLALIAPINIISGLFSYFACLLCLRHLRNYKDLDEAVNRHFGGKRGYKIFYDVIIMISLTVLLILYFGLICDQWVGMTQQSKLIPIFNALALFPIVYIMKKYHFGASLLAYGILSIIGYCAFLTWMWATSPQGPKTVPAADPLFVDLAAALAQGFAIQTFFIPILKQNKNRRVYGKLLAITYIVGTMVYTFIGYSGALSLINRQPPKENPVTIQDYFGQKECPFIFCLSIVFVNCEVTKIIFRKRFFSMFKWPQSDDVTFKEVVYVGATILISLIIKLTQIRAQVLIQFNGSVVSFFFIYVIPIGLHVKCVYFSTPQQREHKLPQDQKQMKQSEKQQKQIQLKQHKSSGESLKMDNDKMKQQKNQNQSDMNGDIVKQQKNNQYQSMSNQKMRQSKKDNQMRSQSQNTQQFQQIQQKVQQMPQQFSHCCQTKFRSKAHQVCQFILMILMIVSGLMTMVYTIITIVNKDESE